MMSRAPYHVSSRGLPHRRPAPAPEPRVDLAKVRALADKLITTHAAVLGDLNDEIDALTLAESKALDVFAFQCVGCENWFAASERVTTAQFEWRCDPCAKEVGG